MSCKHRLAIQMRKINLPAVSAVKNHMLFLQEGDFVHQSPPFTSTPQPNLHYRECKEHKAIPCSLWQDQDIFSKVHKSRRNIKPNLYTLFTSEKEHLSEQVYHANLSASVIKLDNPSVEMLKNSN